MKSRKWLILTSIVLVVLLAALVLVPATFAQGPQNEGGFGYGRGPMFGSGFGRGQMMSPGQGAGPMAGQGPHWGGPANSLVAVAAEQLGLTQAELAAELEAGKTLAQAAEERGVPLETLVEAFLAPRAERLAALVAAEQVTQEQIDQMLATMEARVTEHLTQPWTPQGPGFGQGLCDGAGPENAFPLHPPTGSTTRGRSSGPRHGGWGQQ